MKISHPLSVCLSVLCLGLLWSSQALAQQPSSASLPEWDKLTPAQRETLVAPLRERWNNDPDGRARMLEHGQRWQQMTPAQREQARRGLHRFEHLNPEQREQARALFSRMRHMSPQQREALRTSWKTMTPQQRQDWVEQHPPRRDMGRDPPPPPRP